MESTNYLYIYNFKIISKKFLKIIYTISLYTVTLLLHICYIYILEPLIVLNVRLSESAHTINKKFNLWIHDLKNT